MTPADLARPQADAARAFWIIISLIALLIAGSAISAVWSAIKAAWAWIWDFEPTENDQ